MFLDFKSIRLYGLSFWRTIMIPWHIIDRYQSGFSGLLSIQWQPVKYFPLHLLKVEYVNSIQSVIKQRYHFVLMFQCNLKIKFFIQYSRHYFELTQKSMKWLVNQSIGLTFKQSTALILNLKAIRQFPTRKMHWKKLWIKGPWLGLKTATFVEPWLIHYLEMSLTIRRSKFFESRFNFKYFRSCRLAQTVTSMKSKITARIVINKASWYWNIVRSCTVKSVFQSLS